jgi:hypothetical protein
MLRMVRRMLWPAGTGAERKFAGQQRIRAGSHRARLLVTHVDPAQPGAADRVGEIVERITGHAVAPLRAGVHQHFNHHVRNFHQMILPTGESEAKTLADEKGSLVDARHCNAVAGNACANV